MDWAKGRGGAVIAAKTILTDLHPGAAPLQRHLRTRMPGYKTKDESISIAGVPDMLIRSLLDRQQFSDPHGDAAALGISSASWPLFGLLWPSGAQLAALIALRPLQTGERILEIGCGLALPSLVAHRLGANITASDCHPLAAGFLAANLLLNSLQPLDYRHGQWGGKLADTTDNERAPAHARAAQALVGQYDLIIGSDLLYEPDAHALLPDFIDRHAAQHAEIWVLDPQRGNRPAFQKQMAHRGFDLTQTDMGRAATARRAVYKGRLLTYRRH